MLRIDDPSAVPVLPTPEAAGTEGYFTEGSPGVTPATLVRASFLNMVQEELRTVVVAGGLAPSKTTYNQMLSAIQAMYGNARIGHVYASSDWIPLGGGIILQWGSQLTSAAGDTTVLYPTPFLVGAFAVQATANSAGAAGYFATANGSGLTNFVLNAWGATATRVAISSSWFAVGK